MNTLKEIAEKIQRLDSCIIVGHSVPDGDCIGSMIGLALGLKSQGIKVQMILPDKAPDAYEYLPVFRSIYLYDNQIKLRSPNVIYLDCSDLGRVSDEVRQALSLAELVVNIDHHAGNEEFGHYNYVDSGAAATGEIIVRLLQEMKIRFTPSIADALMAALIMDTGNFLNSSTTAETMRIAADLIDYGANMEKARINLFESKPREELDLLGLALQQTEFSDNGTIAWMVLPYDKTVELGLDSFHPEGLINYIRVIKGVKVSVLFRETRPNLVKVSLRSRDGVDVAALAAEFGGGGHRQASGAKLEGELETIIKIMTDRIKEVV